MAENNETNKIDENESISTYLDFIIFELNRSINRKNILENKAYLLGTALVAFISFNNNFFDIAEEFDISVRREKKKIEQEEEILEYHKETLKIINKRCEEKSKTLKIAIKFTLLFFIIYFLFMLGGEK